MQEGNTDNHSDTTCLNSAKETTVSVKRKILRKSSLRKSLRHKSLEEYSSSSSPEVFSDKVPDPALRKNFGQYEITHEDSNSQLLDNDFSLRRSRHIERSFSEPAGFCDIEDVSILKAVGKPSVSNLNENIENSSVQVSENDGELPKLTGPNMTGAKKKIIRHIRSRSDVPISVSLREGGVTPVIEPFKTNHEQTRISYQNIDDDRNRRKSLLEEGCCSVAPQTECFFPQPHKGQSLTSFLSSEDFHTCAELDKENAHFYISEALISAVEQIKCNQLLQKAEEENEDESDEEICHLKQRIRIRRRERQQEKAVKTNINLLSDGKTDTATTSQSASSPQSSPYSEHSNNSSSGTDDIDELDISDPNYSTLSSIQEKGLSLSMASLYSDADIKRFKSNTEELQRRKLSPEPPHIPVSAEMVALCLLRKFSEKQLPKASDLQWLVSEQDAPQTLLPLPDSWPVSPDEVDEEINPHRTRLRGTVDWAPPRAQIIFNTHPETSRKAVVMKQKYRCAGCGMRIEKGYIHRFRYCKYLGKYFCHCCHSNSMAIIPGYVLQKWDFTRYYVSNFSRDLLERMDGDPLFNIMDINASLFNKSRPLHLFRQCRLQLSSLKDYVKMCKNANDLKKSVDSLPYHWVTEPEVYSLQDLYQIRTSKVSDELKQLTLTCVKHVLSCESCNSLGFICENCHKINSIIFPFQLNSVVQCKGCGACFHKECHVPNQCPKCARIHLRKLKLEESASLSNSDDESSNS